MKNRAWMVFFAVLATAFAGCSSPPLPISVSLTSSASAIDQGAGLTIVVNATVSNDSGGKGVAWSLSGVGSISSTTSSATYSPPTSTIASAQQVTLTATSIADSTEHASVQITVNPYPAIPSQPLATGTVGVPYNQPITLTGGTAPFAWSVYDGQGLVALVGGAVPDGLTLDAATGIVSGTPTAAGTWYFEQTATDADNAFTYNALNIQINPASIATGNAVPFLNQPLIPAAVARGSGALTLGVSGTGFVSGATIDFNGMPLATTFVNSEHLSALVPAIDVATGGTAYVTVVNPAPGGGSSNVGFFQVGASEATVSFVNAPNSPLQIAVPSHLAIADLNQDGRPDLAITAGARLYTMLGNGDGSFTSASDSPISIVAPAYNDSSTADVTAIAVGDFNNSGHPGLVLAEAFDEAAVILLGNGSGILNFSSASFAQSPGGPMMDVVTADFNGDGNLDLAVINAITGSSQVDLGYGKGAFTPAGQLVQGAAAAVGDLNGDGKLDIVVVDAGVAFILLGNGDGTFKQATGSPIQIGGSFFEISVADFNGDGKLDLAAADQNGSVVDVLLGNGDGTFQAPLTVTVGHEPAGITVGDFNNDGKLDIATVNAGDDDVTLLLGNGDGTFTQAVGSPYSVGKGPSSIVAADFNADGRLDLAVANSTDGTVSILLQN